MRKVQGTAFRIMDRIDKLVLVYNVMKLYEKSGIAGRIAKRVGINIRHIPPYLKELVRLGLVWEDPKHPTSKQVYYGIYCWNKQFSVRKHIEDKYLEEQYENTKDN